MPLYRKKPVTINAFKLGHHAIPKWCMDKISTDDVMLYPYNEDEAQKGPFEERKIYAVIYTLEGTMTADYGDYIIQGVNGEIYPCKPDIFEQTYEKLEDD